MFFRSTTFPSIPGEVSGRGLQLWAGLYWCETVLKRGAEHAVGFYPVCAMFSFSPWKLAEHGAPRDSRIVSQTSSNEQTGEYETDAGILHQMLEENVFSKRKIKL